MDDKNTKVARKGPINFDKMIVFISNIFLLKKYDINYHYAGLPRLRE